MLRVTSVCRKVRPTRMARRTNTENAQGKITLVIELV
jgi:hypothetical protein